MNILDYVAWRGDITFEQSPFNEVDNLIFSELAYVSMDGLMPEDGSDTLTVAQLCRRYTEAGCSQTYLINDPAPLLKKAAESARFRDIGVKWFTQKIDVRQQIQFAAVTFIISDEQAYIAFSGTDNTIVGWREDCNISFLDETPGQYEAVQYINTVAARTRGELIIGGHSKGGNLAVYGAAFCDEEVIKNRITQVYSNDGPGFNDDVANADRYLAILDKTLKILPESSLVGILLSGKERRKIIKSSAKGILQHDPYSWCVDVTRFEEAEELTGASMIMDDALGRWVASLSKENKKILVDSVFDALEASGAETLCEISENKLLSYNAILKALGKLDAQSRNDMLGSLKKLLISGRDAVKDDMMNELRTKIDDQKASSAY